MVDRERYKDSQKVQETLQKLPMAVQTVLASNFAVIEMAYRAGYESGVREAKGGAA